MILDMTPILNCSVDKLDFEYKYLPGNDEDVVYSMFPDIEFDGEIAVSGYVNNMSGYMVLHMNVSLDYDTSCARCLEPISQKLVFSFDKDIADGDVSENNDDYVYIENKSLDLNIPLEEQLLLELPSRSLCKEDCKGLCQKCGANLNFGSCNCSKNDGDPRLSILKTLLNK